MDREPTDVDPGVDGIPEKSFSGQGPQQPQSGRCVYVTDHMHTLYSCNFHGEFAQGLVRDIRVRWALEEAGLAYETRLVDRDALTTPEYRAIHPFGKIPALVDNNGLVLFESAAIILYLGELSEVIVPRDRLSRSRVTAWICTAVTTVEWPVSTLGQIDYFPVDREAEARIRPNVEQVVAARLSALSKALRDKPYLEGTFSGADIAMRSVLDMLRYTDLVVRHPNLQGYMDRCAQRPAFKRAMRDHLATYASSAAHRATR